MPSTQNLIAYNTYDKFDDVSALVDLVRFAYKKGITIPQYMPRIDNIRNGIKNSTYCASCSKSKTILYPDYTVSRCENYASKHYKFEDHKSIPPLKLGFKEECTKCPAFELCGGGCAPDMNNSYLRDRWCRLSKELYSLALEDMNGH